MCEHQTWLPSLMMSFQSQHCWAAEQAWCRHIAWFTSLDNLWSTFTWSTKTFLSIRPDKLDFCFASATYLICMQLVSHYFLPAIATHTRHILKWASHCLEGDNDSWDGRFVVSGCWCETLNLACLVLLWHTILSHCVPQNGFTPLMGASKGGHTDVVQLLSSGTQVDLQNKVRSSVNL